MSLASDILKRAAVSPDRYQPSPVETKKPKPAVTPISNRGLHMARVPGCFREVEGWRVCVWDGDKNHHLGTYPTVLRARVAWKLWHLWKCRGFRCE